MARKKARSQPPRDLKPGDLHCRYTAFFDGCCEPVNPGGTAGYGVAIFDRVAKAGPVWATGQHPVLGARVFEFSGMIPPAPTTSNNVAEYLAVREIMRWALEHADPKESFQVFGDSRLIISQLWGYPFGAKKWMIHGVDCPAARGGPCKGCHGRPKGFYADTAVEARELLKKLPRMTGYWIPREENDLADELSKAELKRLGVEFRIQPEDEEAA